jgi:hypothetical protein
VTNFCIVYGCSAAQSSVRAHTHTRRKGSRLYHKTSHAPLAINSRVEGNTVRNVYSYNIGSVVSLLENVTRDHVIAVNFAYSVPWDQTENADSGVTLVNISQERSMV